MYKPVIAKLLLLTAFCLALEIFRMFATSSISYIFLPFNLLLAWVPMCMALLAYRETSRLLFLLYSLGWLLFFPNAPYLITDLIHLKSRNNFPLWFDAIMLYSYSFTGLMVGILSATLLYKRLKESTHRLVVNGMLVTAMLATGYGVYLGRTLRWNSWNIFTHPHHIIHDTLIRLTHPFDHPATYGMTLFIGVLLTLVFLVFESFIPPYDMKSNILPSKNNTP